jgi:precorrin-2 dehydrogenase/sirohydrochlorin ferrochelatase
MVYPVCLDITDKLCVVVGGGTVALRKVTGLLADRARVRVVSPELVDGLARLEAERRLEWIARGFAPGDLDGAFLVFAATDSSEVQEQVVREAEAAGLLVNVIDAPDQCGFQVPAVVRRGDLVLAVSTSGTSPAVAARIRQELEATYGEEYAVLLALMARVRSYLLQRENDCNRRKILFQNVLHDDIVQWIRTGREDLLRSHLREVLGPDFDLAFSLPGNDA